MTDWDDRIVDSALHELAGRQPPDLSARIVIALRESANESAPGSLPQLRESQNELLAAQRSRSQAVLLAAAFLILGLVSSYVVQSAIADTQPVARQAERVALQVEWGAVEFVSVGAQRPGPILRTGEAAMVPASCGARMLAAEPSRFRLGVFPTLQVEPATELEVRSMEFSMQNGVVAATSLTIGVVVGMVTWNALASPGVAASGEVVRLKADGDAGKDFAGENARLLARLQTLEQENARLMTMREGAPDLPVPTAPEVEVEPVKDPKPAVAMMFQDPKYADILSEVDWSLMGKTTLAMQPLMDELVRMVEEGGEVSPELGAKIEKLNADLVAQMPVILKAGLPGTGANGAYTHPLVVANTLATTLQAAGMPLDAAQSSALTGLVRSFSAELDGVANGQYEFEAETVMRETEAKDRFYKEMSQRLTPEQFAAIYPKGSTDFDGLNLFGTGLMTRQLVRPIRAANAAEFGRSAGNHLADALRLNDEDTVKLRSVIESISASNSELWGGAASPAERDLRFVRAGRTKVALANQVAILREVSRRFTLTPEQKKKLATMSGVLIPMH